tara:strand:- start:1370 stop:1678 length:309 start_codon:yes stop_codon:yes gene_type:complete
MNPYITEMEAIPVSTPHMVSVFNSTTLEETKHLAYEAEMQYKRKEPAIKTILCSRLDTVNVGEPVMLVYHHGMRSYMHNRNVIVSNLNNCVGGFYYTNGIEA